jgi:hypothetical protein
MIARRGILLISVAAAAAPSLLGATNQRGAGMKVTRVFAGADGRSHFEDIELPQHEVRAGVAETDWFTASRASLRFIEPNEDFREQPRHPAPRRQVAVILQGKLECEVSDGAKRRFDAGSVVLLEDTQGEGHITRIAQAPCSFVTIDLGQAPFPSR